MPDVSGPTRWLGQALRVSERDLETYTSLDELMLIRFFALSARFFAMATVLVAAPLMAIFYVVSLRSDTHDFSGRVVSMSVLAMVSEHHDGDDEFGWIPWLVVAQLWLMTGLLLATLERETRVYARKLWEQDPRVLGAQLHTVLISDVPVMRDEQLRKRLERQRESGVGEVLRLFFGTLRGLVLFVLVDVLPGWILLDWLQRRAKEIEARRRATATSPRGDARVGGGIARVVDASIEKLPRRRSEMARALSRSLSGGQQDSLTRRESKELVRNKLEAIFGDGCVLYQVHPQDLDRLDRAARQLDNAKRLRMRYSLAQSLVRLYSAKGAAKAHARSRDHRKAEMREVECLRRKNDERTRLLESDEPSHAAVVVFKSAHAATLCSQVQLTDTLDFWNSTRSPGAQDAVWRNMALTSSARAFKTLRARMLAVAMIVYFMVPIRYVREAEKELAETLGDSNAEVVSGVLILVLTTVFLIVGHIASLALSRRTGHVAYSAMDVEGASIYLYLLIVNGVLANLDDTPVWEDLRDYSLDIETAGRELARRLAQSSPFFLSFVLLRTAQSVPLELIHPPFHLGFVSKWLAHKLRGTTGLSETQLRSWTLPEATPLHRVPAQTMLIFFLGQTYAIIAPVLLPACALFFAMFTVVWRHNVVYHYRQRYVAGGNLWPWIVRHVVFSVIFAQVVAIFGTGGWTGTSQRLALVPLPFLTTWVYFAELTPHLEQASVRPLDSTLDKEHADNMFRLEEEVVRERWYDYCPENLKPDLTERSAGSIVRRWWKETGRKLLRQRRKEREPLSGGGGGHFGRSPSTKATAFSFMSFLTATAGSTFGSRGSGDSADRAQAQIGGEDGEDEEDAVAEVVDAGRRRVEGVEGEQEV